MTSAETIAPATRKRVTRREHLTGKERLKMAPTNVSAVENSGVEQPSRTVLPGRHAKEWHGADTIGAYLMCIAVLFAACAALVDLKVALWGFGLLHVGCTLSVLILWWQDSGQEAAVTSRQTSAVKEEKNKASVVLVRHGTNARP